jgi:streptogramin lyase
MSQRGQIWVMTYDGHVSRVDPRSNKVTLRKHLTGLTDMAVGTGAVWALVGRNASRGHLLKLDPVTGRVLASFTMPRRCRAISFGGGQLWVLCGGQLARFLRIDPSTGHVLARSGPVANVGNMAATADGIWFGTGNTGVMGYVGTGSKVTWIGASHRADLAFTASLVYANGSLWAFDSGENVARISPVTGRIIKIYSAARYDPQDNLSLNFFAVDRNSIWFLRADGYETTAVLRVSLATGRRIGRVSGVGSCGEPCWQIYVAQGSAWVPTQTQLVRISPGRAKG